MYGYPVSVQELIPVQINLELKVTIEDIRSNPMFSVGTQIKTSQADGFLLFAWMQPARDCLPPLFCHTTRPGFYVCITVNQISQNCTQETRQIFFFYKSHKPTNTKAELSLNIKSILLARLQQNTGINKTFLHQIATLTFQWVTKHMKFQDIVAQVLLLRNTGRWLMIDSDPWSILSVLSMVWLKNVLVFLGQQKGPVLFKRAKTKHNEKKKS